MFVVWPPLGPLCSRSCSDPVRPSSVCHWFSILASLSGRCSVILVPIRSSLLFPLLPSVVPAIDVRSGCCLVWLNLSNRYAFSGPIVSDEIRLSVCLIRSGPSSFCTCSSGRRSSDRLDSASVAVRPLWPFLCISSALWMYVCCLPAMRPVRLPSHLSGCSSHLSDYVCSISVCTDRLSDSLYRPVVRLLVHSGHSVGCLVVFVHFGRRPNSAVVQGAFCLCPFNRSASVSSSPSPSSTALQC